MTENHSPESASNGPTVLRLGLESLRIGEPHRYGTITAFPLFLPSESGPDYLPLDAALATGNFRVTEVSQAGSVPHLRVTNGCGRAVLILDGEELLGAKQNRVVNLSLLLPVGFEGTIPVSCTEQGRWRQATTQAHSSDVVMELKARRRKASSVSASLAESGSFASDQGEVWDSIAKLQGKAQFFSPTSALHEVYIARERDLAGALGAIMQVPGQHGLLVFVGAQPAGLDLVSRSDVYAQLHPKLVRSYALDAVLEAQHPVSPLDPEASGAFIRAAAACLGRAHRSVGLGETVRAEGHGIVGTGLVEADTLIHSGFFGDAAADGPSPTRSGLQALRDRRRHARGDGAGSA